MKVGRVDGSPEEIRNFIQNCGLKVEDFLENTDKKNTKIYYILPVVSFIILAILLVFSQVFSYQIKLLILILGSCSSIWLAININLQHKNITASIIVIISAVVILLVAYGIILPEEIIDTLKDLKSA